MRYLSVTPVYFIISEILQVNAPLSGDGEHGGAEIHPRHRPHHERPPGRQVPGGHGGHDLAQMAQNEQCQIDVSFIIYADC